jgi:hypothetical protein
MKDKYIVEFTVKKETEEKVTTKKVIDEKEVEVTETKKVISDAAVALFTPGRKTTKASSTFFSKRIGYYTQQGLLSTHMIAKRYDNDGGFLSDIEQERIDILENEKIDIAKSYRKKLEGKTPANKTKKDKEEEEALLTKVMDIQSTVDEINRPYINIFNHSAEYKAREDALMWWLFALSSLKDGDGEYKKIFKTEELSQKEFDENEVLLGELEDGDEGFKKEAIRKATYLISFWLNDGDLSNESVREKAFEDYETHFGFEYSEKLGIGDAQEKAAESETSGEQLKKPKKKATKPKEDK